MDAFNSSPYENRVRLEINLAKIRKNLAKIRSAVAPCKVTAVLKANAYGLGVKRVAFACRDAGAASIGVAELNEALELATLGIPVMILGNVLPQEIEPALKAEIVLPINDLESAQLISQTAVACNLQANCQILLDTGMGRLGMLTHNAVDEIKAIAALPNLACVGIYSHFPVAYRGEDDYTLNQIATFKKLLAKLTEQNIAFEEVHIANSDAINNFPESYSAPFNAVRTGLNLYGLFDNEGQRANELESVVSLKTRLAAVRQLPQGACVGYGRTHRLLKSTLIGTIAAGYADGLPLALSNRGYVLIRGQYCPILGRVSMDYTTVSLEAVPEACCGDEVVCVGTQGDATIPLNNWAQLKGSHPYEVLCSMGMRVARIYAEN